MTTLVEEKLAFTYSFAMSEEDEETESDIDTNYLEEDETFIPAEKKKEKRFDFVGDDNGDADDGEIDEEPIESDEETDEESLDGFGEESQDNY